MSHTEFMAFWAAAGLAMLSTGLALGGMIFRRERAMALSLLALGLVFLAQLAAIVARTLHTGHFPIVDRYENVLSLSAVVVLFTLLTLWRRRTLLPLLVFVAPFVLLMFGYAFLAQPRYTTYSLVLDNLWMFVHIFFAWLSYGAYTVAAGLGVLIFWRSKARAPEENRLLARLPSSALLDALLYRLVVFGFITHAVMVASGSIWARDLWGSFWSWDPVETWSLISWAVYGLWIHLRLTLRWRGPRMALGAALALLTVLLAFWGTNVLGRTRHSLDEIKLRSTVEWPTEGGP